MTHYQVYYDVIIMSAQWLSLESHLKPYHNHHTMYYNAIGFCYAYSSAVIMTKQVLGISEQKIERTKNLKVYTTILLHVCVTVWASINTCTIQRKIFKGWKFSRKMICVFCHCDTALDAISWKKFCGWVKKHEIREIYSPQKFCPTRHTCMCTHVVKLNSIK